MSANRASPTTSGRRTATARRRPRLSAEQRREVLLAAAKQVFGRAGYHEATTREIAAAAGVSEALLYQHFPGKRQLFTELVLAAAADLEGRLLAARGAADQSGAGVAAYFDFVEAESELYRVFFRQALQADPAFLQLHQQLWRRFVELVREGTTPVGEATAHAMAGMLNELALWWLEEARPAGRLTKVGIVEHASRLARAVCDSEVDHGTAAPS